MSVNAIVTMHPYAPFIEEVVAHPIVSGLRLNTVMPVAGETLEELLKRLQDKVQDKDLWIDLKCRQLRVAEPATPPFTEVKLSHQITVETPVTAYFEDDHATVLKVDGNRLIMQEGPRRVIGPGQSVNIIHPSLSIEGYFTELDLRYIEAGQKIGVAHYMLSFVEQAADIAAFRKLSPEAEVVAKIESRKGLQYVGKEWDGEARLMAARGDLYRELAYGTATKPHHIIQATEEIVKKDPTAIAASRIFDSLRQSPVPTCSDISDVDNLLRMGYRTVMLGDYICMERQPLISGLNLLAAMAERYKQKEGKVV